MKEKGTFEPPPSGPGCRTHVSPAIEAWRSRSHSPLWKYCANHVYFSCPFGEEKSPTYRAHCAQKQAEVSQHSHKATRSPHGSDLATSRETRAAYDAKRLA